MAPVKSISYMSHLCKCPWPCKHCVSARRRSKPTGCRFVISRVMADDTEGQLATKADLADLRAAAIKGRLAKLQPDIAWITGGVGLSFLRSIVEWLR